MNWFNSLNPVIQTLLATIFTWGVTALGALVVCFFKEMNKKVLDTILGFSAGVMIASSFWSLLSPALDLSLELGFKEWVLPSIGFIIGGLFVLFSDSFLDKVLSIRKKKENNESLKRSILFVSAITIHNIPEGMAIGVAFGSLASSSASMNVVGALMLALGIGIQNFPEGAAVSLPLRREGYSRFRSFMIGQASAIVEPIAAIIGVILAMSIKSILPILLSFASGAMIVVVARELLPESVKENKNLFILKAFTKIYAMAGLRLGYGLSSDERLLKKMTSVSQPWAVSIPAQIAGVQALKEKEYLKKTEELIRKESNYLKEALRKLNMKIYGSKANYIFFKDEDGHELKAYLENRGIMIRDCSNYVGLTKGYYRICVKEHKDNKRLINEIISFRGM